MQLWCVGGVTCASGKVPVTFELLEWPYEGALCLFTAVDPPSQVFFFLLLSLDVISPCWEILGGGDLEQDSVTCPLLFFLWLYRREPSRSPPSDRLRGDFRQSVWDLQPSASLGCYSMPRLVARSLSSSSSLCLYAWGLHEHQNKSTPGSNWEKEPSCPFLYFFNIEMTLP